MEAWLYPRLYELEDRHWWFRGRRAVIRALLERGETPRAPAGARRRLRHRAQPRRVRPGRPAARRRPRREAVAFCRAARAWTEVSESGLDQLPFEDGSFDLLLATDVVEHVDDDVGALRELRRVAAPDARLLLTVPAYQWLWSAHDDSISTTPLHLPQLVERVRAAGWEPMVASYFNAVLLGPIAVRAPPAQRQRPQPTTNATGLAEHRAGAADARRGGADPARRGAPGRRVDRAWSRAPHERRWSRSWCRCHDEEDVAAGLRERLEAVLAEIDGETRSSRRRRLVRPLAPS